MIIYVTVHGLVEYEYGRLLNIRYLEMMTAYEINGQHMKLML